MKRFVHIKFILCLILVFNSCDTPINEYQTKNDDEKQMMTLLQTHLDARNNGDLKLLQSTFHDDGVYISGDGIPFPKAKIIETDPEWWVDAGKVQLLNPEIKTNGNEAEIFMKVKAGVHYTTAKIYYLTKENNQWLIMKVK